MEQCKKTGYKLTVYIIQFVRLWPLKTNIYIANFVKWYGISYTLLSDNTGIQVP